MLSEAATRTDRRTPSASQTAVALGKESFRPFSRSDSEDTANRVRRDISSRVMRCAMRRRLTASPKARLLKALI